MPLAIPISTRIAIRRARQGILLADLLRMVLTMLSIVGFICCLGTRYLPIGTGMLFALPMAWLSLAIRTARNQQQMLRVPALIEAKQFEEAEQAVADGLSRFSLVRGPRLQALQHLAYVRHAQRNYAAAQQLANALLRYRLPDAAATGARLLLAECALEAGDLLSAHATLTGIGGALSLRESLKLLELQTDYCIRISAWQSAIENLPWKIELAELLSTDAAARMQAGLALAAKKMRHETWADWLKRRCELLVDPQMLIAQRPIFAELFPPPTP